MRVLAIVDFMLVVRGELDHEGFLKCLCVMGEKEYLSLC